MKAKENKYSFVNSLVRFKLIIQIFICVILGCSIIYAGALIVSVQSISDMAYTNMQQAQLDKNLQRLEAYSTDGNGNWEVKIHTQGEPTEKKLKDLDLVYSLRFTTMKEVAYLSEQNRTIVQVIGTSFYLDYLASNQILLSSLGYIVLMLLLMMIKDKAEFGWVAKKGMRIATLGLGILQLMTILVGLLLFSL